MKGKGRMTALPIALFIFSGSMLTLGKGGASWAIHLILAAALACFALPVACVAAEGVFGGEREKKGIEKVIFIIFSLVSAIAAIYSASLMLDEFSSFASRVMFLRIPSAIVSAIFVAFCSYLASCRAEVIKKFAFVSAIIVFVCSLILFALSAPNFEWDRVNELLEGAKELSATDAVAVFSGSFAPAVIAIIYFSSNGGVRGRSALFGTLLSFFLILICFLNVFLLLGGSFGASMEYPYAAAVSTVTAGKLFARLEGFAYITYYVSSALRVAICVSLVSILSERVARRKSRALPYVVGVLVFAVTLLLSRS